MWLLNVEEHQIKARMVEEEKAVYVFSTQRSSDLEFVEDVEASTVRHRAICDAVVCSPLFLVVYLSTNHHTE